MASSVIKPGILVGLQELEPSSPFFKEGQSVRVTGKLESYNVESAMAVIVDGGASLLIDTQNLRDICFRTNSIYQFIGELLIPQDGQVTLKARVGRNVDGIDLNLYHQSIQLRRKFEAHIAKSKTT
ncbi:CST complex subunit TEN1 [Phalaenopsis equestris]|uniref:CST complex subunit TEN1 n=1 Tax=Phalaenopsis equestris TaxID=78828 RepID=UPI0009E1968B|nr:CST complex subunit TEN1 [Phalaenopsis equestris]